MVVQEDNHIQQQPLTNRQVQKSVITAFAVKEDMGKASVERLTQMMHVLFNERLEITSEDIHKEKSIWTMPFLLREAIYCINKNKDKQECGKGLPNLMSLCPCGAPKSEKAIISTSCIIPQILLIIKKHENELFKERRTTENRRDLMDYIEAYAYDPSHLHLYLIINTDGVVPKQSSRKPFFPIMLMVKNLPAALRSSFKNLLIAAIIHGPKSPSEFIWNVTLSSLESELLKLKDGIDYRHSNGNTVKITASISDVIVDQIASQNIYQHASHSSNGYACTTCETSSVRIDKAQRYPLQSAELRDGTHGIGLPVVSSAFNRIAPMNLVRLDGLHVLDEGLCKTLLNLLWDKYKTMDLIRREVNRCMLANGSTSFSYSTSFKNLNAHQLRLMFSLAVPILCLHETKSKQIQVAYIFWLLCRILYSKYLNLSIINNVAPLFEKLGRAMESTFGSKFKTIKGHRFFGHGGEELLKSGTPADFSASPFEAANRLLKLLFDPYNTRGFQRDLIKKFLEHILIEPKMEELAKKLDLDPSSFAELFETKAKVPFGKCVPYKGPLLPLMEPEDTVFFSAYRNGISHKFNPNDEQFSYFKALCDGSGACFKAVIGIQRNGEKFLLAKKIEVANPMPLNIFDPQLKPIAEILSEYQSFMFQFKKEEDNYSLIPVKNILSFILFIQFSQLRLLFDVSERFNKT